MAKVQELGPGSALRVLVAHMAPACISFLRSRAASWTSCFLLASLCASHQLISVQCFAGGPSQRAFQRKKGQPALKLRAPFMVFSWCSGIANGIARYLERGCSDVLTNLGSEPSEPNKSKRSVPFFRVPCLLTPGGTSPA